MMRTQVGGILLAGLIALSGCSADSPTGGRDGDGGNGGGENGGSNGGQGNGGNGGGQGAPINIPSIVQDQGRPLSEVQSEIEASVREQCGGELCIELRVVEADPNFGVCQFVRTDPVQGTSVDPGETVLILAGTQSCDDPDPTDEETDGDGTGEENDTSDGDSSS